jgi:PI-3-kinase-related kinase SMG-1
MYFEVLGMNLVSEVLFGAFDKLRRPSVAERDRLAGTVVGTVGLSNSIFSFQELNFNFHTIILPEALKTIQTEEPTVLAMAKELNDIITGVGCPLEDILAQLEMHLRYIIMAMDVCSLLK